MKKIPVNFDEIQKAMEDVVRDASDFYLDLETGEVIALSEKALTEARSIFCEDGEDEISDDIQYIEYDREPEIPDGMEEQLETILMVLLDESGRYVRIPERRSAAAHQSMSEFLGFVEDASLKAALSEALQGKGAFRRFKQALGDHPGERKEWHRHNAKSVKKEIIAWLNSCGIQPVS